MGAASASDEGARQGWFRRIWSRAYAAYRRDVIERPKISPFFGAVLGALVLLLIALTLLYSAGGAASCEIGASKADGGGAIPVLWGYWTIGVIAFLALAAGWEPILGDTVQRAWRSLMSWFEAQPSWARRLLRIASAPVSLPVLALMGFAWICCRLFSFFDFFLAQIVARLAGATMGAVVENRRLAAVLRYAVFLSWVLGGALVAYFAPAPYGLIGVLAAALAVFGVTRRWSWVESDREAFLAARRYDPRTMRVGFLEDLRDEALTGLVLLFLLIPLALRQVHLWSGDFHFVQSLEGGGVVCTDVNPSLLDWVGFFGAELLKAAPVVDWSEVFEVSNGSPIQPTTAFGAQLVFFLRVTLDLLLLASVVQAVQIATRLRDQNAAFEAGLSRIVDPFSEGRRLFEIGRQIKSEMVRRNAVYDPVVMPGHLLPPYDEARLSQIADIDAGFDMEAAPEAASLAPITKDDQVRLAALGVLLAQHGGRPEVKAAIAKLVEEGGDSPRRRLAALAHPAINRTRKTPPEGVPIPEMVDIPGGGFVMGSPEEEAGRVENEGPQRTVSMASFALGKYAVTFEEYDAFCAATGANKPGDEGWGRGRRPVINVDWYDAQAYCAWLRETVGQRWRLPTEAEWEYACRAETTAPYFFGDAVTQIHANFGRESGRTVPVEDFAANAFGVHQMHGNVWEWCADPWHERYDGAPADQRVWIAKGDLHGAVLRGGAWSNGPELLRSAYRGPVSRVARGDRIGFRVAQTRRE